MPAGGRQCVGIYYQLRLQFLKVTVVHLKCHAHQNGVSGDAVRRVVLARPLESCVTCLHLFAYRKAWEWSAGLAVNLEIIYLRSREHILKSYTNPTRTVSLPTYSKHLHICTADAA